MAGADIYWEGASGRKYEYWIFRIGSTSNFKDEPGNFIYAKEVEPGRWRPVFVGRTSSLKYRLASYENEACAKRNGASHIHAHTDDYHSESARQSEEIDLLSKWSPVCNEYTDHQLKREVDGFSVREHQTTSWIREGWRVNGEGWLLDLTTDVADIVFGWRIFSVIRSVVKMFASLFKRR